MHAISSLWISVLISFVAAASLDIPKCRTPAEYKDHMENKEYCHVGKCLFGRFIDYFESTTQAHKKSDYAWSSNHEFLQELLLIRMNETLLAEDREQLVLDSLGLIERFGSYAEYYVFDTCMNPPMSNRTYEFNLDIHSPIARTWSSILYLDHNISVPHEVMNNLTKDFATATGGCNSTLGDGSSYNSMFDNVNSTNDFGCSNDFIQAWSLLGETGTRYDTVKVFKLLKNLSDPIELPWLRAALWAGQNVNPMNTFDGFSHNGLAKHFPEFIVRNLPLDKTNLAGLEHFSLIDMFATNTTASSPSPTSSLTPNISQSPTLSQPPNSPSPCNGSGIHTPYSLYESKWAIFLFLTGLFVYAY